MIYILIINQLFLNLSGIKLNCAVGAQSSNIVKRLYDGVCSTFYSCIRPDSETLLATDEYRKLRAG
jgi:hypothetical protein